MKPSLAALLFRVFVSYMEKYSHTLQAVRISDSQETMQEPSNLFARDNHVIFEKKNFLQLVYDFKHCNLLSAGLFYKIYMRADYPM